MFSLLLSLSALALLAMFTLGCGSSAEPDIKERPTPTAELDASPTADATKEYLLSLPKWERQQAQWKLDQEEKERVKHNAREQVQQWIDWATPDCKDFYGSGNCEPAIIELVPSEVCGFKFGKLIRNVDDVQAQGHYYVMLVHEKGYRSGGYEWIASYGHKAYRDRAVLNITQCWAANPSEIGRFLLPTNTPKLTFQSSGPRPTPCSFTFSARKCGNEPYP